MMADGVQAMRRHSSLKVRNVRIGRRRTSLRLEMAVWDALSDVARREGVTVNQLLTEVAATQQESSFTASVRVYVLRYYRRMAMPRPMSTVAAVAH